MVNDIARLYKYNQPEQSTPTFNKYVLSYSAAHASSASNSTGTSISSQLYIIDITTNKKEQHLKYT